MERRVMRSVAIDLTFVQVVVDFFGMRSRDVIRCAPDLTSGSRLGFELGDLMGMSIRSLLWERYTTNRVIQGLPETSFNDSHYPAGCITGPAMIRALKHQQLAISPTSACFISRGHTWPKDLMH